VHRDRTRARPVHSSGPNTGGPLKDAGAHAGPLATSDSSGLRPSTGGKGTVRCSSRKRGIRFGLAVLTVLPVSKPRARWGASTQRKTCQSPLRRYCLWCRSALHWYTTLTRFAPSGPLGRTTSTEEIYPKVVDRPACEKRGVPSWLLKPGG
jgi:hypothetical protein